MKNLKFLLYLAQVAIGLWLLNFCLKLMGIRIF